MIINHDIFTPTPKQRAFMNDPAKYKMLIGSKSSGKSWVTSVIVPLFNAVMYYQYKHIIVQSTFRGLKETVIPLYTKFQSQFPEFYSKVITNFSKVELSFDTGNLSRIFLIEENPRSDPNFDKLYSGILFTSATVAEALLFKDATIYKAINSNLGRAEAFDEIALHKQLVKEKIAPKLITNSYFPLEKQTEVFQDNRKILAQFSKPIQTQILNQFAAKPEILWDTNPRSYNVLAQLFVEKKLNGQPLPKELAKQFSLHTINYQDVEEHLPANLVKSYKEMEVLDDPSTKIYVKGQFIKEPDATTLYPVENIDDAYQNAPEKLPEHSEEHWKYRIGIDPAYYGKDLCVYWLILEDTLKKQFYVIKRFVIEKSLDLDIVNAVDQLAIEYNVSADRIACDCSSNKVSEYFERYKNKRIIRFKPSNPPIGTLFEHMKFNNIRAESHWALRVLMKKQDIFFCMKRDYELDRDLMLLCTEPMRDDAIVRLPDKHKMTYSPDFSDSLIIGIYGSYMKPTGRIKAKSYLI